VAAECSNHLHTGEDGQHVLRRLLAAALLGTLNGGKGSSSDLYDCRIPFCVHGEGDAIARRLVISVPWRLVGPKRPTESRCSTVVDLWSLRSLSGVPEYSQELSVDATAASYGRPMVSSTVRSASAGPFGQGACCWAPKADGRSLMKSRRPGTGSRAMVRLGERESSLTTPHKLQSRGSVGKPALPPPGRVWTVAKRRPRSGSFMR